MQLTISYLPLTRKNPACAPKPCAIAEKLSSATPAYRYLPSPNRALPPA